MFRTLLIANRGEIACRIQRTARRLGLRTVAVYSDADAQSRHVRGADAAYRLGPAPAAESYLRIDRILAAATSTGAEAIHPGYGFLAENADFAAACEKAGLVFVGPPAAAIRAMGSKRGARTLMAQAGVPVVAGYQGADQSNERLAAAAREIGFPVMLKPALGGGGKGMRRVDAAPDLAAAVAAARREAEAAFGDGELVIEQFMARPRHVEVQIFCDRHGNAVHLFERDCSLQRRHQKVIEEAPAPGWTAERRRAMTEAALAAARAVGYVNAGTVEFLVGSDGRFFFMEMNTRLQVEHAVTEMITGQDLVEWQLRVAAGEPLPLQQHEIAAAGHAIEARVYAEVPDKGFLPSTGRLSRLRLPSIGNDLRWDAGVEQGDRVGPFYDPMVGKLIAHGPDRPTALRRLTRALAEIVVDGIITNIPFLLALLGDRTFFCATTDAHSIDRSLATLLPSHRRASDAAITLAVLAVLAAWGERRPRATGRGPWGRVMAWRLNLAAADELTFEDARGAFLVGVIFHGSNLGVTIEDRVATVEPLPAARGHLSFAIAGTRIDGLVQRQNDLLTVVYGDEVVTLRAVDPLGVAGRVGEAPGAIAAPIPGKVVHLHVRAGQTVAKGAPLLVVEAMKMEHTVVAAKSGMVRAVHCREGVSVQEGSVLVEID